MQLNLLYSWVMHLIQEINALLIKCIPDSIILDFLDFLTWANEIYAFPILTFFLLKPSLPLWAL